MGGQRLFVHTSHADDLVEQLPEIGLMGVKVAPDAVRVEQHEFDETTLEDIEFELDWHADKLWISGFRTDAADWVPPAPAIPGEGEK